MNRLLLFSFVFSLLSTVAWTQDKDGHYLYETAISNIESDEYQKAYSNFQKIQQDPELTFYHSEALYWLVKVGIVMQSYSEAAYYADMFLSQFPFSDYYPEINYHRSRLYLFENQPERSLESLNNLIRKYPTSSFVSSSYYWMGEALVKLERLEDAQDMFNDLLQRFPASVKREATLFKLKEIKLQLRESELLEMLKVSHTNYLEASAQVYLKGLENERIVQMESEKENEVFQERELRARLFDAKNQVIELRKYYIDELLRASNVY